MVMRAIFVEHKERSASNTALLEAVVYLQAAGCVTDRLEARETTWDLIMDSRPDVVLLSTGSGKTSRLIAQLKEYRDAVSASATCVLVAAENAKWISEAYTCGATVVAPAKVFVSAVQNVITTQSAKDAQSSLTVPKAQPSISNLLEQAIVAHFHEEHTGRLDARRVAKTYGLSLTALSEALGVTQSAISKRATSPSAQPGLRELEAAWATLLDALGSAEKVRAWLHAKRADLDGRAPFQLLTEGSAQAFAKYVRSVVAGEPG